MRRSNRQLDQESCLLCMSFSSGDEAAFQVRRGELLDEYAEWLASANVQAQAGDAGLLMDWKWGYQDGELARWTVTDLEEFLLGWCPRKLSMRAEHCADFPSSIRACERTPRQRLQRWPSCGSCGSSAPRRGGR